jgi:hypothetical protein
MDSIIIKTIISEALLGDVALRGVIEERVWVHLLAHKQLAVAPPAS